MRLPAETSGTLGALLTRPGLVRGVGDRTCQLWLMLFGVSRRRITGTVGFVGTLFLGLQVMQVLETHVHRKAALTLATQVSDLLNIIANIMLRRT